MRTIYEPTGKALEYSPLACNLFTGCSFGCKYCYCPKIRHTTVDNYCQNPQPRQGILQQLAKDAPKFAGDPREVLFCFMSDPYQSEVAAQYTHEALKICEKNDLRVQVLTKNPAAALPDIEMFRRNNWKIASTIIL